MADIKDLKDAMDFKQLEIEIRNKLAQEHHWEQQQKHFEEQQKHFNANQKHFNATQEHFTANQKHWKYTVIVSVVALISAPIILMLVRLALQ